jgi:DNA-binding HxlR family transcriptional regulator
VRSGPENQYWQRSGALIQILAGRWTLAVFAELADCGRRYQGLHASLSPFVRLHVTMPGR